MGQKIAYLFWLKVRINFLTEEKFPFKHVTIIGIQAMSSLNVVGRKLTVNELLSKEKLFQEK